MAWLVGTSGLGGAVPRGGISAGLGSSSRAQSRAPSSGPGGRHESPRASKAKRSEAARRRGDGH